MEETNEIRGPMTEEEWCALVNKFDPEMTEDFNGVEATGSSILHIPMAYRELFAQAILYGKSFIVTTHIDHDSQIRFEWDPDLEWGCVTIYNDGLKVAVQDAVESIIDLEFEPDVLF